MFCFISFQIYTLSSNLLLNFPSFLQVTFLLTHWKKLDEDNIFQDPTDISMEVSIAFAFVHVCTCDEKCDTPSFLRRLDFLLTVHRNFLLWPRFRVRYEFQFLISDFFLLLFFSCFSFHKVKAFKTNVNARDAKGWNAACIASFRHKLNALRVCAILLGRIYACLSSHWRCILSVGVLVNRCTCITAYVYLIYILY